MSNTEWVIAGVPKLDDDCTRAPSAWNFYASRELAEKDLEINGHVIRDYYKDRETRIMTYDDYVALERRIWLSEAIAEISPKDYDGALGDLPPKNWEVRDGVERFNMIEHTSGVFTRQYAIWNGRYFSTTVDATDRSTWMTAQKIEASLIAA